MEKNSSGNRKNNFEEKNTKNQTKKERKIQYVGRGINRNKESDSKERNFSGQNKEGRKDNVIAIDQHCNR